MRGGLSRLVRLFLLAGAMHSVPGWAEAVPQDAGEKSQEYRNINYAYKVRIPLDLNIETNAEPNPNHGFRAKVGAHTLWVFAGYDDGPDLRAALKAHQEARAPRCKLLKSKPTSLAGRYRARLLVFECAGETPAAPATVVTEILAYLQPHNRGSILYEISYEEPKYGIASARTARVFREIAASFRLIPVEL